MALNSNKTPAASAGERHRRHTHAKEVTAPMRKRRQPTVALGQFATRADVHLFRNLTALAECHSCGRMVRLRLSLDNGPLLCKLCFFRSFDAPLPRRKKVARRAALKIIGCSHTIARYASFSLGALSMSGQPEWTIMPEECSRCRAYVPQLVRHNGSAWICDDCVEGE